MTPSTTVQPSTKDEVIAHYREAIADQQRHHDAVDQTRSQVVMGIGLVLAALVYLTIHFLHTSTPGWWFALGLAALAGLIWYYLQLQPVITRSQRLRGFYERAHLRADGTEPQSGRTGTEAGQDLRQPGHLYDRDLDILGEDSLFGLLATIRTGPGERGLAGYLLSPASQEESIARQQAVKELLPQTNLREEIALIGATSFHQFSASFFDEWIDEPAPYFHPFLRYALVITAIVNVILLLTRPDASSPMG